MSLVCDEDLPPYGEDGCAPLTLADADALAYIKPNQTTITDYTNAAQWLNAIANGDVSIMKNISVSVPEPSAKETNNPRVQGPDNIHTKWSIALNYEDATINDANLAFHAATNGKTGYAAWRLYEENKIVVALYPLNFKCTPPYGEKGGVMMFKGGATGNIGKNDTFLVLDAPAGIFD